MPEQLAFSPELSSSLHTEPQSALLERVRASIPIVPNAIVQESENVLNAYVVADRQPDGTYTWIKGFYEPYQEGEWVDPMAGGDDKTIFETAESVLRTDNDFMNNVARISERWWGGANIQELVDTRLKEAFKVSSGEKNLDILNCSESLLSDDELAKFQKVLQDVASFTGNKFFDRVQGIVIGDESLVNEGSMAAFNSFDRLMRINMCTIREAGDDLHDRYKPYFPADTSITTQDIAVAHELGHAMDITSLGEADAHFINKDSYNYFAAGSSSNSFSAFDDQFGWTHEKIPSPNGQLYGAMTRHRIDPTRAAESGELGATWYSQESPREDFAETFAIAALGGDTSSFSNRAKVVSETVATAKGDNLIGPQLVTIEPIVSPDGVYRPDPKVKAIALRVKVTAPFSGNPR